LRERAGFLTTGLGGRLELPVDPLDVRVDVYGSMMASRWHHVNRDLATL